MMAQRQAARRVWGFRTILRASFPMVCQPRQFMLKSTPAHSHLTPAPRVASLHTTARQHNADIINIQDEEDFKKRVLDSQTPVIVDFHAGWCGPCKMLGPRLESLVSERAGKVLLAKVDIDDNADVAMEHGVQAVPTVLGLRDGKVVNKFVGVKDDDELTSFIDGLIR